MASRQVNVRFDDRGQKSLKRLEEHYGIRAQQLIRMLVRREDHAVTGAGEFPAKPRKR